MTGGIGSARRGPVGGSATGSIPSQRTASDAYRVSDDQLDRARLVVAKNSADTDDLRELLDMLGLISSTPDLPAAGQPVNRAPDAGGSEGLSYAWRAPNGQSLTARTAPAVRVPIV